ncbi:mitochondrial intermembrane space import and assembly protein 40-B isoform X2 [Nasonia vitripennis]|uniref:CHCH domain-containing protein n=1 Tax=Nasonia vitripennis TaxID=7425 RepID=A0A7M7LKW5_NASVI|nr:mitochondrial intermembrane space import and assembly protein 40-B isoform X2 [Nasonia vitripennis]XP_032455605.1 mitochondrial intermembrane space import and assembly protein 40-B isoform X2 [Nasonia vitripennis]
MSIVRKEGKDTIIFATKEDHATPSKVTLPAPEPSPGLILPNGEINWNCPCLGGMATGPCGVEFREAFSCFHYSTADPKGSDCYEAFKTMQGCMSNYPALYANKGTDMDDLDNESGELENKSEDRRDLKEDEVPEVRNESSQSVTSSKKEVEPAKAQ